MKCVKNSKHVACVSHRGLHYLSPQYNCDCYKPTAVETVQGNFHAASLYRPAEQLPPFYTTGTVPCCIAHHTHSDEASITQTLKWAGRNGRMSQPYKDASRRLVPYTPFHLSLHHPLFLNE